MFNQRKGCQQMEDPSAWPISTTKGSTDLGSASGNQEPLTELLLTVDDIRLLRACVAWHAQVQTNPYILERFERLRQRLSAARVVKIELGSSSPLMPTTVRSAPNNAKQRAAC
jgi:hypothetical protein